MSRSFSTPGMVTSTTALYAAMCIPVGKVSLEDCDLFTSSFAFTTGSPSPILNPARTCALLATTSFTFILLCVPEPVCHITNGN